MTPDEALPHPPGHQLAPGYVVIEHVRRGEDLDCYETWSSQRYCRCFVKTLQPDAATDASARRYLKREARLLLSLSHPHLVRAYEYIVPPDGQPPLLVLENLTGATLSYLLNHNGGRPARLSAADLRHLGQQLCSVLRYLHSRGYLHLDVKPSNIIASHGVARLIDLSLARPPGHCPAGTGTPGYLSPEQLAGGELGPPADVWGVGLVLYQAATATQPFDLPDVSLSTGSTLSRCDALLAHPAPKVRARRRLPPDVATVIDACLHRDPDRRPTLEVLDAALATLAAAPESGSR
ncbi:MAG TPA: serine/threonine-protein kinase [Pseudonocardiaceae bacterium]|nr:serine/threonine-protein kinase [Pseudonocardiaceae bacterium]